jgi:hypothetical protein
MIPPSFDYYVANTSTTVGQSKNPAWKPSGFRRDEPYSSNEVASAWVDSPDRPLPVAPSSASGCPQPSQRWCDAHSGRGD